MKTILSQAFNSHSSIKVFLFLFALYLCNPICTRATDRQLDSLYTILRQTNDINVLTKTHIEIAKLFWTSNPDSAFFHIDKADGLITKTKVNDDYLNNQIIRSNLSFDLGHFEEALHTMQTTLQNTNEKTDPVIVARIISNIGNCYAQKGDLSKAIENYTRAISYLDENKNVSEMAVLYGRLGNLYYQNKNYNEGIVFYKKASRLFIALERRSGEAISSMNIGNCYKQLQVPDSAIFYYNKALKQYKAIGNMQFNEAQCLANLGNIHAELLQTDKALKYLLNADSLFNSTQNLYSIAQVNSDIAYLYLMLDKPSLAKNRIDKCLEISKKNGYDRLIETGYRLLWKYYDKLGDCSNAYEWLNKYSVIKDSIGNVSRQENIDKLLTQFETERKEKEIELLKQSEEINRLELRRKSFVQHITLIGLLLMLIFTVLLYLNNIRRKRLNQLLTRQNAEINQQKEEIITQRDEIENQRDMLQDQNYLLERFHENTTHSLRYAQSIQAAILPSEKVLRQISPNYFVLMKPCELVSGDFYWATCFDEHQILCVADCTGHGVPGAFMSILGITALNDIVVRHRITKPGEILGHLRSSVIESLSQNDVEHLHKDGLDIALCSFNLKTRELQYAGAKIPLWIVSDDETTLDKIKDSAKQISENGRVLYEINGDIMPVGHSPRMSAFTNHSLSLKNTKATIYLATDGFADQLGGSKHSKYGSVKLKKGIISNSMKPFAEQQEILHNAFDSWMGSSFQVDDVTILGIKI